MDDQKQPKPKSKKWLWTLLITALFLVGFAGGVIYWSLVKTKNIANSVLDAAKNAQTVTTPTPSAANSTAPAGNLALPAADTPGEDLPDVPRFSGAIRSDYAQSTDNLVINLEYFAPAEAKNILDYYKKTLPNSDWILRAEDNRGLTFNKTGADLTIEIIEEASNLTQYRIHFFRTQGES